MKTIADAWNWYEATKRNLACTGCNAWAKNIGAILPLPDSSIWQDDNFKMVEASHIEADTKVSLKPIDDLAVVVLFSVFESRVRDYLIELIKPQAESISEPILKEAVDDAIQGVKERSFYRRVLEPLKKQNRISADLITQVDQIRDYRNWVAHGRRDAPTNNVTPKQARERLFEFLAELGIAAESEEGHE